MPIYFSQLKIGSAMVTKQNEKNPKISIIYSHKVDVLHVIHVYHVLALALGLRVTKQALSEYDKSHSRGKGEKVASHARALSTSVQVCHVSPGLSFHWPK